MVVKAAPLTAKPPAAVNSPPTLKTPASDAFPIVREPMYAAAVLIVVVDKPPARLNDPASTKLRTYAFIVLIEVVDIPPPRVAKPVVTIVFALKLFIKPIDVET